MRIWPTVLLLATLIPLAACAYRPKDVADPEAITLRAAVFDVANSLADIQEARRGKPKVGMIVDEATVVFNINSKANDTGSLKLDSSLPASSGIPLALTSQYQLTNEGYRGNQITIKFKNLVTSKVSASDRSFLERCNQPNPPRSCDSTVFSVPFAPF